MREIFVKSAVFRAGIGSKGKAMGQLLKNFMKTSAKIVARISKLCYNTETLTRPCGQAVKTAPSHGAIPGSIPGKVTKTKCLEPSAKFIAFGSGLFFLLVCCRTIRHIACFKYNKILFTVEYDFFDERIE